ncbi:AlpA family transcriptional regulator [Humitalea rosea]|uniref:AlpA family transcriptional regulator n=1 Tax=Humitalea rosea TaxID=990373 RepID=A0A2W7IDP9_9PROT|nr:XRE family transcriptional regulator [Humitalea rosea]PZW44851.1 AlpA family transcriptional regulator [Humitalea rosea]
MRDGTMLPGWPLLLRRELAAQYVGMSPSTFDGEVRAGRVPKPIATAGTLRAWHRGDLEAWAEDQRAAAHEPDTANPWDSA